MNMNNLLSLVLVTFMSFSLPACEKVNSNQANQIEKNKIISETENLKKEEKAMKMSVNVSGNTIIYELNDSKAAKDLYEQLPLSIEVENYSNNEKIFYPPKQLDISDTPTAGEGGAGTLAYYEPWGDVVMFYGSFGTAGGLYELGHVVSGTEYIKGMSGTISLDKRNE